MATGIEIGRRAATSAVLAAVVAGVVVASRRAGDRQDRGHPAAPAGGTSASASASASASPTASPTVATQAALPRGGRELFPEYRLVGYSGGAGSAAFGRLGVGDLDARVREIERLALSYTAGRRAQPVLELIAVVAQPRPGADGRYRVRIGAEVVGQYLAAARRHRALLLLNVQPGRARFIDEIRALERWLVEPEVGVALDPEWAVGRGQVPGRVFGRTTGSDIDEVADYLDGLVTAHDLPQKALVVHQLRPDIVSRFDDVTARPGVAVVKSVDGIGPPKAKISTWTRLVADLPTAVHPGFKLFFSEDAEGGSRVMTAGEVLALRPTPEYVLYE
jgi:hypothetical protein